VRVAKPSLTATGPYRKGKKEEEKNKNNLKLQL